MGGENGDGIWEGGGVGRVGVVEIMGGENGGGMQPLHILNRGIVESKPYKPNWSPVSSTNDKIFHVHLKQHWFNNFCFELNLILNEIFFNNETHYQILEKSQMEKTLYLQFHQKSTKYLTFIWNNFESIIFFLN